MAYRIEGLQDGIRDQGYIYAYGLRFAYGLTVYAYGLHLCVLQHQNLMEP